MNTIKCIKWLSSLLLLLMMSCSEGEQICEFQKLEVYNQTTSSKNRISVSKALEFAKIILEKHNNTRTNWNPEFILDYITVKNSTRSNSINDTIAYIFNTSDNKGFAIIAADNRLPNVLGFSDVGYFDQNYSVIQENFTNVLEQHYLQSDTTKSIGISYGKPFALVYQPKIYMSIGQWNPYNKYVSMEHNGYPVG